MSEWWKAIICIFAHTRWHDVRFAETGRGTIIECRKCRRRSWQP